MRCNRSAGSIAPSVWTVGNRSEDRVGMAGSSDLRQVDVDTQDVRRQLRLDTMADALGAAGRAHPAMGLKQFRAPFAGAMLQMRPEDVESVQHRQEKMRRLVWCHVCIRLGLQECFCPIGG